MQAHTGRISAQTQLLGILGHPVAHSLSPVIHNAALRHDGLDMVYLAFDVAPEQLDVAVQAVRTLHMRGVNVTVPHKETALRLMDDVDPLASRVGAINTIVNDQGRLLGHNTDVTGFTSAVDSVLPEGVGGLECLVVGAGGAARAVVAALVEHGAKRVRIYNRTPDRALALSLAACDWGQTTCETVSLEELPTAVRTADVLVNATPIGLAGGIKEPPFPVDKLHSSHVVVDLAYSLSTTTLVQTARGKGAVAIDGREMLIMQAVASYRLWTGLRAPIDVMRRSIDHGER